VGGAGAGVTGEEGCGRTSTAALATKLDDPPSASLAGRWVFCPTTYPMANATANNSTTIKNPLSSCLFPTTSSNSPVSLFLMF
jgi:ABC-type dipeptide/oligopeptide/nickel transport system ATPase component